MRHGLPSDAFDLHSNEAYSIGEVSAVLSVARVERPSVLVLAALLAGTANFVGSGTFAQDGTNACPVDGCQVRIVSASNAEGEIALVFEANFQPDLAKNHIHVWWGENFDVKQVSANAESTYHVEQGVWHPTDDYPDYVTTSVVSVAERGEATTLCVTAADRNHDILDPALFNCRSVAELLE
jgi:hypothetical protein